MDKVFVIRKAIMTYKLKKEQVLDSYDVIITWVKPLKYPKYKQLAIQQAFTRQEMMVFEWKLKWTRFLA